MRVRSFGSADEGSCSEPEPAPLPADALPLPAGLGSAAVLRALEREALAAAAPELEPRRRERILRVREEVRRGRYLTPERLAIALERALAALRRRR